MHTDSQLAYLDGNHRMAAGDVAGAETCFLRALALEPMHGPARANLGYLKERQGALAEAEFHYLQAIALMPDHAQLYQNMGVLLLREKRFAESESAMRTAVEVAPESASAWCQLGVLLACTHREFEGEECYRQALMLDPEHARARFNLSYLLLRQARFAEGWRMLDARWLFDAIPQSFDCHFWEGEPLEGKSVIVCLEAGHGDMIHFIRYVTQLKAARVAVLCQPGLKRLFATLAGVDEVYALGEQVPEDWDFWTRAMRLPGLFGTELDNIPAPIPYLSAQPELARHWREQLPQQGLRVGLAWKGNPNFESDADRSLPSLMTLAPLAAVPAHFVSLQKGAGEEEALRPPAGMSLHAIGPQLGDFADTAAVIANLDLVISVDTAVAHLAGAMGKPCWLLLPDYRCDWRWMAERDDSPWYPSMRLFRRGEGEGWAVVVDRIAGELLALPRTAGHKGQTPYGV
jgi:tetratricopeptide (TPR) repeat protein